MEEPVYRKLGSMLDIEAFLSYLQELGLEMPCEKEVQLGDESPLAQGVCVDRLTIGNRFAIAPMEGWDGAPDGSPGENTFRRWRRFGSSGAKLIWGGEAVAVCRDGRSNPNQLLINEHTRGELARLRQDLVESHRGCCGSTDGLLIGLQLAHAGRFSRPRPRILYHHPVLDGRLKLSPDYPVLTDVEVRRIVEHFHHAAAIAHDIGFDFVDIKHCHGYLGHEFLSAHTREGDYGGRLENRTRFLREVVEGIRATAPGLQVALRLSAFDTVPFRPDPQRSRPGRPGPGIPEPYDNLLPYRWGFGVNPDNPLEPDLTETVIFLELLRQLGIRLVNISAGSAYYNPHIMRPAMRAPSGGYAPPEDPLVGVARQMQVVRTLKKQFPDLVLVGSAYSYLQQFLPHVAQAAVDQGWVDCVGLGRMALCYPELPREILQGGGKEPLQRKRFCVSCSDCTTAPRSGLPSGCYHFDSHYKQSEHAAHLRALKEKGDNCDKNQ